MDKLQQHFNVSLQETRSSFHRYMYRRINWNNRMIGLTGPRGVGKTTLILQYIKLRKICRENSLFMSRLKIFILPATNLST